MKRYHFINCMLASLDLCNTLIQPLDPLQELIASLEETKAKAVEIKGRLDAAATTARQIEEACGLYSPVAARGAVLYFALVDLAALCSMYQYSLAAFLSVFVNTLKTCSQV